MRDILQPAPRRGAYFLFWAGIISMSQDKPAGGFVNAYELTLIVRPDLDEEHTRGVVEQVSGRLEAAGGEIIAVYPWSPGRRRMAYPIRNYGDGFYATMTFQFDPQSITPIENALKLNENI